MRIPCVCSSILPWLTNCRPRKSVVLRPRPSPEPPESIVDEPDEGDSAVEDQDLDFTVT